MSHEYQIVDVFTNQRFGGNPLAVILAADNLDAQQMQSIAREFNFSESTFVLSATDANAHYRLRIFTPTKEVPFAGHPIVGTAYALACDGAFGDIDDSQSVRFEVAAGDVDVQISARGVQRYFCELKAPETLSVGMPEDIEQIADVLSLSPDDIAADTHLPCQASVGLAFTLVELTSLHALQRASMDLAALRAAVEAGLNPDLYCYVRSGDDFDVRARMFAPLDGVVEDPATGSANAALTGLLATFSAETAFCLRIAQGVEMGRPSLIETRALKRADGNYDVFVGGEAAAFARGQLLS